MEPGRGRCPVEPDWIVCAMRPAAALLVLLFLLVPSPSMGQSLFGGCCLPDASCIQTDQATCAAMGGTFLGNVPCDPDPCTPPVGACCFPDGSCRMVVFEACDPHVSVWLGPGAICDPCNPCVQCAGACCWPDGSCTLESTYECCIRGGNPNCMDTCTSARCATSDVPEENLGDGRTDRRTSWGKVRTLYR
jgi:hypothetical protein